MRLLLTCLSVLLLTSCSYLSQLTSRSDSAPETILVPSELPNAVPRPINYKVNINPKWYVVNGVTYHVLKTAKSYNKRGIASWYGTKFHGRLTASGEPYDMYSMTAASKVLPIPCYVRVTNLKNGRSIVVRVNDRGPFVPNRILDLSYAAAVKLGMIKYGTALVQVTAIDASNMHSLTGYRYLPFPKHIKSVSIPKADKNIEIYLQVGAYTSSTSAKRRQADMRKLLHRSVIIHKERWQHKHLYRVQIGPITRASTSDALIAKLKKHHIKAITVIR